MFGCTSTMPVRWRSDRRGLPQIRCQCSLAHSRQAGSGCQPRPPELCLRSTRGPRTLSCPLLIRRVLTHFASRAYREENNGAGAPKDVSQNRCKGRHSVSDDNVFQRTQRDSGFEGPSLSSEAVICCNSRSSWASSDCRFCNASLRCNFIRCRVCTSARSPLLRCRRPCMSFTCSLRPRCSLASWRCCCSSWRRCWRKRRSLLIPTSYTAVAAQRTAWPTWATRASVTPQRASAAVGAFWRRAPASSVAPTTRLRRRHRRRWRGQRQPPA